MLVMVQPSWDIASFGELASGIPVRPWMIFHIFVPSEFDTAFWRRSFQLSVLVSLIASVALRQVLIHSCRFWWIARRRLFWVQILARTCWAIQGLGFLLGFVFPTCLVAVEMRVSLKRDIRRDKFGLFGRLFILDSTSFLKHDQSMSLSRHLAALETTNFVVNFNKNRKMIGATNRLG